jgi:hypothetical protein
MSTVVSPSAGNSYASKSDPKLKPALKKDTFMKRIQESGQTNKSSKNSRAAHDVENMNAFNLEHALSLAGVGSPKRPGDSMVQQHV